MAREALVTLFWPDESVTKGKANLRRELHNLTNVLPGCWETDYKTVRLSPDADTSIDIDDFRRLEEAQKWIEAAELLQGEFLEGVYLEENLAFETWLLGERERWRQRADHVLRKAVDAQVAAGDKAAALTIARRLLQLRPWQEEMHRQVMLLLAQLGQSSAALKQYEVCKQILRDELGVTVSAETQALYERIRDPSPFALHNVPASTAPFIGRQKELTRLRGWLEDKEVRLITISGAGGMGKTRLMLALAEELLERQGHAFPDGIYLVRLVALDNATQLVTETAAVLKFPLHGPGDRSPKKRLLDYLSRKRLLLLFDNFEHLLSGASLLTDMLRAAPDMQIVTTSREKLGLRGEQLLPLSGLLYDETPMSVGENHGNDAADFFVRAARRAEPDFMLRDSEGVRHLQRICRLVAGMPLALELAATWTDTLSLAAIAGEIERGLDLLERDVRDLPARHRSMRAVFDASWQRLEPETQHVFAKMAHFRGPFSQQAAQAITNATKKQLSQLVHHSLLTRQSQGLYTVHEMLRQFAAEKLTERAADSQTTAARFAKYYMDFLEERGNRLYSAVQRQVLAEMNAELDNVRAAWEWCLAQHRVKDIWRSGTTFLLVHFYDSRYEEAAADTARTAAWASEIAGERAELVRASALNFLAYCQIRLGYISEARASALESKEIYSRLNKEPPYGYGTDSTFPLALVALIQGNPQQALDLAEQLRVKFVDREDALNLGLAHYILSSAHQALGQFETAFAHALQATESAKRAGHEWFLGYTLLEQGKAAQGSGRHEEAKQYYEASIPIRRRFNDKGEAEALGLLGEIALLEQDYAAARRLFQEALEIYRDTNDRGSIASSLHGLARVSLATEADDVAREQLHQALVIAEEIQFIPLVLAILVDSGKLLLESGETKLGLELLALAQRHSAAKHETGRRATEELQRWNGYVDASLYSRSIAKGTEGDLKSAVESLKPLLSSPLYFMRDGPAQ
ncbi:MAG: BTAD domain-containing putative transcriptional regulator [Candidatus Promineifilaceae bacterium]|nr:BTAD domain-containing putative transcriptional regulator [Candidatus Promineifilaceae bacterium]